MENPTVTWVKFPIGWPGIYDYIRVNIYNLKCLAIAEM